MSTSSIYTTSQGRMRLLVVSLLLAFVAVSVNAADGDLDLSFDVDGKVKTDIVNNFDAGSAMAIQSDGKIVVAGYSVDFNDQTFISIVRYHPDGTLDPTFGVGGRVITDIYVSDMKVDVAIQGDGKIVVVGTVAGPGYTDFGIARYDASGNPDPTFGVGGKAAADFGGNTDEPYSIAIQGDGKLVVAGGTAIGYAYDIALARFETDGTLDAGFGTGGMTTVDLGQYEVANGVAIQSDGKIVAAGITAPSGTEGDFAVVRFDPAGTPDAAFDGDGVVTTDFFARRDEARAVVIQPGDGKIVVVGSVGLVGDYDDFGVARYDTNGGLDAGFGVGGKVNVDFFDAPDGATDVALQSDGKIVVAGFNSPDLINIETRVDFGVARLAIDGTLDATFGTGGIVSTDFGFTDFGESVAIQQDCQIVAAGYSWPVENGNSEFALARYNSSGCVVEPPGSTCPRSHGHWKSEPESWPVDSLTLGSQTYTKAELLSLLNLSSQTDASVTLARQLIAAKLNIANGSDPTPVSGTIAAADAVLSTFGGKLPYKVKSSSAKGQQMTAATVVLTNYNNGLLTPTCTP